MVAVYELDFASLRWTRVSVFKYEADADFYIMMRRRYIKNLRIRKEVMSNAENG